MSDAVVVVAADHYLSYARGKYLAAYTLKELGNIVDVAWVMARDKRLTIVVNHNYNLTTSLTIL